MINGTNESGNMGNYLDRIGLWFIFTACAGISLIVWAFNWVCWLNQCCCCDFLHNPINKRIAWWMSFSFLLGILACCISAFVSVNRFGFALEGAWCAAYRVYYDSLNGTLKTSDPKWEGFSKLTAINKNLYNFYNFIRDDSNRDKLINILTKQKNWDDLLYGIEIDKDYKDNKLCLTRYTKIIDAVQRLAKLTFDPEPEVDLNSIEDKSKFEGIKTEFLDNFDYYEKILRACMKVLAMIYYCLLLIVITAAGVSMMFYACLKRQGYLLTFMKVLWNIIRFFMFSFFLYGTAYGIGFLALRDAVACVMYIFNENLYQKDEKDDTKVKYIGGGTKFFKFCLDNTKSNNLKTLYDPVFADSIEDFFTNYRDIKNSDCNYGNIKSNLNEFYSKIEIGANFNSILDLAGREGGIFGSFDCSFVKSDLNVLYTALYDASVESRNLAALSLSASFFGAVAVYFYLLVMHHYNNDLFFDSGKSIFKGFDGFGGGYHKKNKSQDPAYKKRKLRAELELTSKNDEQSNNNREYKDVNKNEEED